MKLFSLLNASSDTAIGTVSMKTQNSESTSLWTKAPAANLVRYEPSGICFVRAKGRGKLIPKSLDTYALSVAKLRLADVLDTEHNRFAGDLMMGELFDDEAA
jgi:hypothetical protein